MSAFIRTAHRWLSISFVLMVLANFAVMGKGDIALWVGSLTLVPLFLLALSGLYMFALPYVRRRRAGRAG